MSDISVRIDQVRSKILDASKKVNRNPEEILLLGVTKTVDVDVMEEALKCGITDVGENKPQELQRKYGLIGNRARWHQIGTLQTNKVKYIIDKVDLIHSLDRMALAEEINKRAEKIDRNIDCLVQVNISKEETKHGIFIEDLENFIRECARRFERINIVGLMTMAPDSDDEDEVRSVFRQLREVSDYIRDLSIDGVVMKDLSMGMSGDYQIAIEEGSTIVRVGTSIFGKRNYNI
ncbi:hypothetical protein HMPREF1639_04460 [Peptostreptococcus sp. MV1]|uniref:YggS family pyridoxal phosphate-dependent enzyme n=1 Tax=Peptostreptococcus sp. MV1 TaxID=1219626 RepID=UPI000510525C|nr:YggS family pyridoxal phosphate-dependent enzyme [Peptostreptococcus sp. MV1]KGF13081.1 hypothetical protein HMPREF1639_04460 [Peptostreptococcus sp. MV1]